jgi:hypothetical protein
MNSLSKKQNKYKLIAIGTIGVLLITGVLYLSYILLTQSADQRSQAARSKEFAIVRKSNQRDNEQQIDNDQRTSSQKTEKEQQSGNVSGDTAKRKPIFVQLHTYFNAPFGVSSSSTVGISKWGYWQITNSKLGNNPDVTYSDSPWRRKIYSITYPNMPNQWTTNFQSTFVPSTQSNMSLQKSRGSYPFIGPYNSYNPNVVKWHVQLAKNAGIDAFAVSVFDIFSDNRMSGGTYICQPAGVKNQLGGVERFKLYADVAQANQFKVFVETWVPANGDTGGGCGSIQGYEAGLVRTINQVYYPGGSLNPVIYTIDNKPVIFIGPFHGVLDVISNVERTTGKQFHWIMGTSNPEFYTDERVDSVALGHVLEPQTYVAQPNYARSRNEMADAKNRLKATSKLVGARIYGGFDDSMNLDSRNAIYQTYKPTGLKREAANGNTTFLEQLENARDAKADFYWIESWNDYGEQSQIEPSWYVDGVDRSTDPYRDLRNLAAFAGKAWNVPPLPPKSTLDPLITGKIGL